MTALLPSRLSPFSLGALTRCSNSLSGESIYKVPSKQLHLSGHLNHTPLSLRPRACVRQCARVCVCVSAERPADPCFSRTGKRKKVRLDYEADNVP